MKTARLLVTALEWIVLGSLAIAGICFLALKFVIHDHALVVENGSMRDQLPVNSVIFIDAQSNYNLGDIVTFRQNTRQGGLVTHKIVGVTKEGQFVTQGTANKDPDAAPLDLANIVGKESGLRIPFIGNFVHKDFWLGLLDEWQTYAALVLLMAYWLFRRRIMRQEPEYPDDDQADPAPGIWPSLEAPTTTHQTPRRFRER